MNAVKISKVIDVVVYLAIIVLIALKFFSNISPQTITLSLLIICFVKLIGTMGKSNFYEKEYKRLKDENDFLMTSRKGDKTEK